MGREREGLGIAKGNRDTEDESELGAILGHSGSCGHPMSIFEVSAILIVFTALLSFINARFIRLPTMIGVMFLSLVASLALDLAGGADGGLKRHAATLLAHVNFNEALLHGMLAFLLFAGALHLNLNDLAKEWGAITALALIGTALSTFAIGGGLWFVLKWVGLPIPLIHCMLFGALISPTDPVAVLAILKSAGAPRSIDTLMAGESLFNDGVGIVIFFVLLGIASGGTAPTALAVGRLLIWEAGGGIALGLLTGYITYQLLRQVDNYQVEVLLTLALAMGGYALGNAVGVSAPIAIVVAGLLIGNQGRKFGMSEVTRHHLDTFWELMDEILNAVLFMLLGLQVLVMPFRAMYVLAGVAAIVLSLSVRFASVAGLIRLMSIRRGFSPGTITVLTWGGLRGGLSVAMALSLPAAYHRNLILAVTYCVVVFSILIQGLTTAAVTRQVCRGSQDRADSTVPAASI
jgi:CPA1 family monovalent cation:H+ antiporter